jgi:hypothetical protein
MPTISDAAYERLKEEYVAKERRKLLKNFVSTHGFDEGLLRLSEVTGRPLETYRRMAEKFGLTPKKRTAGHSR